jgi:hypothetical protein
VVVATVNLRVDPAAIFLRRRYGPVPIAASVVDDKGEAVGGVTADTDDGYLSDLEIF